MVATRREVPSGSRLFCGVAKLAKSTHFLVPPGGGGEVENGGRRMMRMRRRMAMAMMMMMVMMMMMRRRMRRRGQGSVYRMREVGVQNGGGPPRCRATLCFCPPYWLTSYFSHSPTTHVNRQGAPT